MNFILRFKSKIAPGQFSRLCLLVAAIWFLVIYPGLIWFCPAILPPEMKPESPYGDFIQYYAGAVVVRHGIWDSLYPIPNADVYGNPNHFTPLYRTFLFNPSTAERNPAFYKMVGYPNMSEVSPELFKYFPRRGYFTFIYPPPAALFVWPLSFVSFDTAANFVWPTICILAMFLLAFSASRIHRHLCQADSYSEGLVILVCLIFSIGGRTHISDGNITIIISSLLAFSIYSLMRKRLLSFSCGYIPLVLFKMIGLTWLPLLLIGRFYWRALVYLALIALLLNGIVFGVAGLDVYEKFFSIAPKIIVPTGVGIVPSVVALLGFYPHAFYLILNLTLLGLLYYGYWKKTRVKIVENPPNAPILVAALLAGTMALYCLFNLSIWLPYCPNYLFFPFLGWIIQEGHLASGFWRYFILGGVGLGCFVLAAEWIVKGSLSYLLGPVSVVWYHVYILQPCCVWIIPAFFLVVSIRRLLSD